MACVLRTSVCGFARLEHTHLSDGFLSMKMVYIQARIKFGTNGFSVEFQTYVLTQVHR